MKKKVAIIHTSFVSVDDLKKHFAEIIPEADVFNIVDDSLLPEVMENGAITPGIIRRICDYAVQAELQGADVILNQCSSVGEAASVARKVVHIPIVKVDEQMAEEAVALGTKIGVVATVASTMGPSVRLIEEAASKMNRDVSIELCLVDGALEILMKEGDRAKHNRLVREAIENLQSRCDVIVLAQGSMTVLLPELEEIKVPVLTSPKSGVKRVRNVLGL